MLRSLTLVVAALVVAALAAVAFAQPSDAVYVNANVYTADAGDARAEAFVVRDGRFGAVGSEAAARADGAGLPAVDLGGATVLPGLIDAHAHLTGLGALRAGVVDLSGTRSYEEVIERVRARAAETPRGEWVLGRGWDNESWPDSALPHHGRLSAAVPDHPVSLGRVDGHALLANARAMDIAGVSPETPSPPGGEILRDATGAATGVFVDNAEDLIGRVVPASAYADTESLILAGQQACLEVGLVSVHDMGSSPEVVETYLRMASEGTLKLRMDLALSAPYAVRYFEEHEPTTGGRVSVRSVKLYADGAMGSRGAWLLEPYADRPLGDEGEPYAGLAVMSPERLERHARHALEKGYAVRAHAIGDRGNREVLDAFERAAAATGVPLPPARFRIEHAQLLHAEDIPRFAQLGVIASVQPTHCTSDMRWIAERVGEERARYAYAWASLARSGAVVASGSDFPVEHHDPLLGFYAAVTRQNLEGMPPGGWHAEQRMTRTQALRSMTIDAAYAAFAERDRGSVEPGKAADFVVLDTDVMTCDPGEIPRARVLRTVIAGETVFGAGG